MRLLKSHPFLKLVNAYIIDHSQPTNISYLWNFGVRRVRALIIEVCPDFIVYSSVYKTLCKLRVFTNYGTNNHIIWVVENNNFVRMGLPPIADKISRCSYVEDNKLDTQWRHLFRNCILSRICRYIWDIAYCDNQSIICWWEVSRHPNTGNLRTVQATKATRTLNGIKSQPRDLIAYDWYNLSIMRKRSFHSSLVVGTKGNSQNVQDNKEISPSAKNRDGKVKLNTLTANPPLAQIISLKLSEFKTHDEKYNKFIHLLSDPYFLVACYEEIKGKAGNMTRGVKKETLDGISWLWFEKIAEEIKKGKFNFSHSRRIEIPKRNSSKMRPLTIASPFYPLIGGSAEVGRDKIVQKALQVIIEAIWEKEFLDSSHGFRPKRSVHSALSRIYCGGQNFIWVIQGDLDKCFDTIPHNIVLNQIKKKIVDTRMLELLNKFLKAGHIDPTTKKAKKSNIGVPQGGILSPILCNIVMHQFDEYMTKYASLYEKGKKRRHNPLYKKIERQRKLATTKSERIRLLRMLHNTRNVDSFDPNFRRMRYIRYADDFVIMTIGTKDEAKMIKHNCKDVLKNKCGASLNENKTIITHMEENKFNFLGAEIVKLKRSSIFFGRSRRGRSMVVVRRPLIKAPIKSILNKMKLEGYIRRNCTLNYIPQHLGALINLSHYDIVSFYNSKIHGVLNFYSFASNLNKLGRIIWLLQASCALTLARKFKLDTLSKTFRKFGKTLKCTETGKELFKPENLRVRHFYQNTRDLPQPEGVLGK